MTDPDLPSGRTVDHHTSTPEGAAAHARYYPSPEDLAVADLDAPTPADYL